MSAASVLYRAMKCCTIQRYENDSLKQGIDQTGDNLI